MNSKTTKSENVLTLICKILLFLLLTIVIIIYIGNIYKETSAKNKVNLWNKQRFDEFYNTEKNTIDIVFIGSSHSYCTFDPQIIDKETSKNSYQMGMPLQHPDASYYTLLEVLKYQKPKTVVFDIYFDVLKDKFDLKQSDTLFLVLNNQDLINDYIKNVFPLSEKVKYKIPAIRYQQDFFAYRESKIKKNTSEEKKVGEEYYKTKGFIYCDYVINKNDLEIDNQYKNYNGKTFKIASSQLKYINKIIETCKNENIELILTTAPISPTALININDYENIHNTINKIADENNIKYIDFNEEKIKSQLNLPDEYFRDEAHLNYTGAEIVSNYISDILLEN